MPVNTKLIDVMVEETVDALLDMVEERAGSSGNLIAEFGDIVGCSLEKWGLYVMRQNLERANAILSVFEANTTHLDVRPHWTTAKCGDRWLVYFDNLAVTLDEAEPPNYRSFGYATEAVEWILEEGSIKYPSNSPQVQNEVESDARSNDCQIQEASK